MTRPLLALCFAFWFALSPAGCHRAIQVETYAIPDSDPGRVAGLPALTGRAAVEGCLPTDGMIDRAFAPVWRDAYVDTAAAGAALAAALSPAPITDAVFDTTLTLHELLPLWRELAARLEVRYAVLVRAVTYDAVSAHLHEMFLDILGWPFSFHVGGGIGPQDYGALQVQLVDLTTGDVLWEVYAGDVCPLDPEDLLAPLERAAEVLADLTRRS